MRSHRYRTAILATAAVLFTGALGVAADDATIQEKIEARFDKKNIAQDADVRVAVQNGEVTLTGVATSLPASREAEKLARKEAKVVHNQVRVHIEETVKDAEIVKGIRQAILRYPRYDIFDYVEFGVQDGAVVLVGSVVQPLKKQEIEARVAKVPGIRGIKNDIQVQSFSRYDSDLRYSLARRIYEDPRFIQYANQPHPPIRILVDRGRVTLAGWVNSPVEKALLGNIALGTPSFTVSNQLHVDGEVPEEDAKAKEDESTQS
jgi:osmotically-inducible protein OsmY